MKTTLTTFALCLLTLTASAQPRTALMVDFPKEYVKSQMEGYYIEDTTLDDIIIQYLEDKDITYLFRDGALRLVMIELTDLFETYRIWSAILDMESVKIPGDHGSNAHMFRSPHGPLGIVIQDTVKSSGNYRISIASMH